MQKPPSPPSLSPAQPQTPPRTAQQALMFKSNQVATNGELLPLSRYQLVTLTIGLLGLQFCWAVQVGNVTKVLLTLGLAPGVVSYAWLAGPIAGIIAQPLVGTWSDRCTLRIGRRRPFLIAGTCISVICLLVFAFAKEIGERFGDVHLNRPVALTLAVSSFWALDFSLNAAQGPLRALLGDRVPKYQHPTGNSYFALMTGLGNLLGSAAGAIRLTKYAPMFPEDLSALYALAAVAVTVTMTITVLGTTETPLQLRPSAEYNDIDGSSIQSPEQQQQQQQQQQQSSGLIMPLISAWRTAPEPFHRVFAVQCATWFGWFALFVFGTSWVGKAVYGGHPEAAVGTPERALYEEGVRTGNLGLALQSAITVCVSLFIPLVLRVFGDQIVYLASHLMLATCLIVTLWTRSKSVAIILLAATGIPWAVTMALPWSMMGQGVSKRAPGMEGVYFSLFNLSQCLPEVVVSMVSPYILAVTNSQASVLGIGGLVVLLGAIGIVVSGIGKEQLDEIERLPTSDVF